MGYTNIKIASAGLQLLGEDPIEDFEDPDNGKVVGQLYQPLMEGLISRHPWAFAKTKKRLTRDTDAPLTVWRYQFQMPPDRLADPVAYFTSTDESERPYLNFDINGDRVLTDTDTLYADYLRYPPEGMWPGYFVLLAINACAATFALAVTEDTGLHDRYQRIAFGTPEEGGEGGLLRTAKEIDARGRPNSKLVEEVNYDLISARFGG